jgi:hypothetical protein
MKKLPIDKTALNDIPVPPKTPTQNAIQMPINAPRRSTRIANHPSYNYNVDNAYKELVRRWRENPPQLPKNPTKSTNKNNTDEELLPKNQIEILPKNPILSANKDNTDEEFAQFLYSINSEIPIYNCGDPTAEEEFSNHIYTLRSSDPDTLSYNEVMALPDSAEWQIALDNEVEAINKNQTWEVTTLPQGEFAIGSRVTFRRKRGPNNEIVKRKARLIVQGCFQTISDNVSTYSPVASFTTMLTILIITSYMNYLAHQADVDNAFLNAKLENTVYIRPPKGLRHLPMYKNKVLKLLKSLYGLREACRAWFDLATSRLRDLQWIQAKSDPCLFTRSISGFTCYLILYVDDISIFAPFQETIDKILTELSNSFPLKKLGSLEYILGIRIVRDIDKKTVTLDQEGLIDRIIERFLPEDSKPSSRPISNQDLSDAFNESAPKVDPIYYQSIVSSLMHVARHTRPDISFAVSFASRFNANPTENHQNIIMKILRYLFATKSRSFILDCNQQPKITTFVDADWGGCKTTRRSTTGIAIKIGSALVNWSSKLQQSVTLSTMESEYIALSDSIKKSLWIQSIIQEIQNKNTAIILIRSDNQAAIKVAQGESNHIFSKHIDIRYHFVKDLTKAKKIDIKWINSKLNPADILTKPISKIDFNNHAQTLGISKSSVVKIGGVSQSTDQPDDQCIEYIDLTSFDA